MRVWRMGEGERGKEKMEEGGRRANDDSAEEGNYMASESLFLPAPSCHTYAHRLFLADGRHSLRDCFCYGLSAPISTSFHPSLFHPRRLRMRQRAIPKESESESAFWSERECWPAVFSLLRDGRWVGRWPPCVPTGLFTDCERASDVRAVCRVGLDR